MTHKLDICMQGHGACNIIKKVGWGERGVTSHPPESINEDTCFLGIHLMHNTVVV